jgi:arylsulfatase A-like enzyme
MDSSQVLLPEIFKANGYATAAFGKWHLGFEPSQHPLRNGFDYYYGFLSGSRSYFYRPAKDDQPGAKNAICENLRQVPFEGYLTDVLADKAAAYIKAHRDKPFLMYWAPNAVHTPMEASREDLSLFENHPRKMLAAMTFSLDRAVGVITSELKKQGLYENTLIFFLNDNGGAHNNQSDNYPLKGFKGNKFEAGHRVPFLLSWPAKISGNRTFNGLSSSLDIFPTALEAAGIKPPAQFLMDGVTLWPYLHSKGDKDPHPQLVWRKDKASAIRMGKFKLIQVAGVGDRLYDLQQDPGETKDLVKEDPKRYQQLKKQFLAWEKDKMKPIWTEGHIWDTITTLIHDDLMHNRKVKVRNPEELTNFLQTRKPIQQP